MEGEHHTDNKIQIIYLVTAMNIDLDKFANFRQSPTFPIRLKEKRICMWDAEKGISKFWLIMDQTKEKQTK